MIIHNGIILLRALAAFMIVGCHLQLYPRTACGEFATSLCDVNVGLFAAISGYLMISSMDGCVSLGAYVWKRAKRLLPIYVVWTVFYLISSLVFSLVLKGGGLAGKYTDWGFWRDVVIWGGASCHLWFVISLFYANVIFSACYFQWRRRNALGVAFLVVGIALVCWATVSDAFMYRYPIRLFGFVALGMAIRRLNFSRRIPAMTCGLAIAAGLVVYFVFRCQVHSFIRGMLVVIPLLILFTSQKAYLVFDCRTIKCLAECSMGVFLIHPFFAAGMSAIAQRIISPPFTAIIVICDWVLIYVLSVVFTMAMLRVKVINRFVR